MDQLKWRVQAWHEGDPITIKFSDGREIDCQCEEETDMLGWEEEMWCESSEDCDKAGWFLEDDVYVSPEEGVEDPPTRWREMDELPDAVMVLWQGDEIARLRAEVEKLQTQLSDTISDEYRIMLEQDVNELKLEIERLKQQVTHTPSPELWQQVQSERAAALEDVERLRAEVENLDGAIVVAAYRAWVQPVGSSEFTKHEATRLVAEAVKLKGGK